MDTCRKGNMVNQAYNASKSLLGGGKADVRGWTRSDTYDWEIKLHIASQPLKEYMEKINYDIMEVPEVPWNLRHKSMGKGRTNFSEIIKA